MAGDKPEQEELEAQMEAATEAICAALLRLLQEGQVHPQLLVLAVTRVAGELGASAALASGQGLRSYWANLLRSSNKPEGISTKCCKPWRCPWPGAPESLPEN
jgi:hypothetical protein